MRRCTTSCTPGWGAATSTCDGGHTGIDGQTEDAAHPGLPGFVTPQNLDDSVRHDATDSCDLTEALQGLHVARRDAVRARHPPSVDAHHRVVCLVPVDDHGRGVDDSGQILGPGAILDFHVPNDHLAVVLERPLGGRAAGMSLALVDRVRVPDRVGDYSRGYMGRVNIGG